MKLAFAALFAATFATVASAQKLDIVGIATADGKDSPFTTLVAALQKANLVTALSEPNGPYTVFAPTNDAFANLPDGLVSCLLKDEYDDALKAILTYHVTDVGAVLSTELSNGMAVPTLNGEEVDIAVSKKNDDEIKVRINDGSNVIIPDVEATNGIVHVIDSVLVPPSIDVAAFLSTCQAAEAAAAADAEKHAVTCSYMGVTVRANEWLTGPTHTCKCAPNGHWTGCYENDDDKSNTSSLAMSMPTIEDLVLKSSQLETLETAIFAAGLDGVLSGDGPFTVFAPTDRAFDDVPQVLLNFLLENENSDVLKQVLLYHVVSGAAASAGDLNLGKSSIATALDDNDVVVEKTCWSASGNCDNGQYSVLLDGGSNVIATDVEAKNGIVHIVDQVLIPPSLREAVEDILAKAED